MAQVEGNKDAYVKIEDAGEGWYRIWLNLEEAPLNSGTLTNDIGHVYTNYVHGQFYLKNFTAHVSVDEIDGLAALDGVTGGLENKYKAATNQYLSIDIKPKTFNPNGETNFTLWFSADYDGWSKNVRTDDITITYSTEGVMPTISSSGNGWTKMEELEDGWYRLWIDLGNAAIAQGETAPAYYGHIHYRWLRGTHQFSNYRVYSEKPAIFN